MRLRRVLRLAAALAGTLLLARGAAAQPFADPGIGVGLLGFYARTPDAEGATFTGGAHVLGRVTGVLALELYAGYRRDTYAEGGTSVLRVSQVPVQLSLVAYLLPNLRAQPYLLGGGGYYRIWTTGLGPQVALGEDTENKFALHAGAGVDVRTGRRFSVRIDGRWVFLDVDALAKAAPGKSAGGWQAGLGFNLYF